MRGPVKFGALEAHRSFRRSPPPPLFFHSSPHPTTAIRFSTIGHTRTNKQPPHTHILTENKWKIFRNKLARVQCQLINSLNSIAYKQQVELVRNYVIFEIRFPKYCCAYSFHIHRRAVLALARAHTHTLCLYTRHASLLPFIRSNAVSSIV